MQGWACGKDVFNPLGIVAHTFSLKQYSLSSKAQILSWLFPPVLSEEWLKENFAQGQNSGYCFLLVFVRDLCLLEGRGLLNGCFLWSSRWRKLLSQLKLRHKGTTVIVCSSLSQKCNTLLRGTACGEMVTQERTSNL